MFIKVLASGLTILTLGASALGFSATATTEATAAKIDKDSVEYVEEIKTTSADDSRIVLTPETAPDSVENGVVKKDSSDKSEALIKELEELRVEKEKLEKEKAALEAAQKANETETLKSTTKKTNTDTSNNNWGNDGYMHHGNGNGHNNGTGHCRNRNNNSY